MIIELPKNATKKQVEEAIKKLQANIKKKKGRGNISKHFGVCKSKVDGLEFQKKVRSEWD
ncbi:hypothetical protein [Terrimonas alba]|uniref:hypothetical protein n=1 Tax=Terrimonas alba TaxID=3349636 RepID=UPI0035F26FD7